MGKFVLAYRGGGGVPQSESEQQAVMAAWGAWFGELGAAVVDGGAPFGASSSVSAKGAAPADGAPSALTGYSILTADSLADAAKLAGGCPVLDSGGTVEVYEAIEM
jgi:hypothetical protein